MPRPPKSKPPRHEPRARDRGGAGDRGDRGDRTSAVVAIGLGVLAIGGVLTVFSGPLLALVAPPQVAAPEQATDVGRGDGGAHS
jgi:hypothetical protein